MSVSLATTPVEEQSDLHLLACLVGGPDRLQSAHRMLAAWGSLDRLARVEHHEMEQVVGHTGAIRLKAAFQLGFRTLQAAVNPEAPIHSAEDAYRLFAPRLAGLADEELHAVFLNRRNLPLSVRRLTRGNDACTIVDPRQVFRPAVAMGAVCVVLAHNHPSGDPSPSGPDREITRRVHAAGQILGVRLVDHLVIAGGRYVSMALDGSLPAWSPVEVGFAR